MLRPTDPIPAYQARRKELADQLEVAKSRAAIEHLQGALFVTDVTAATLHDLSVAIQSIATMTRNKADKHLQRIQDTRAELDPAIGDLNISNSTATETSFSLLLHMSKLQASSAKEGFRIALLKGDLLLALGCMWLEMLDHLYTARNRAVYFARVDKLLTFAASNLPVVGHILDALKIVAEVYAAKKIQARDADEYFSSLESYLDAGNLYVVGAISFCAQIDSFISGTSPPTQAQLDKRVRKHIQNFSTGSHPTSADS